MSLKHNPLSFLTGDDPFIRTNTLEAGRGRVDQEFTFEIQHEGFIGIPHGGLAMGMCLDAWTRVGSPSYPIDVRFKFGGTGVMIGDSVLFSIENGPEVRGACFSATITKNGDKAPYLRAEISPRSGDGALDVKGDPTASVFRDLPYYRNCFVCGHHRSVPGLQRRFRLHADDGPPMVTSVWGDSSDDDRAELFLIGREELHPAVLTSIFDENTAWAGFMQTKKCGLSVRLAFTLLRPVASSEMLLFVGLPGGIRGNPRSPRFFLGEGAIFSIGGSGAAEPVAFGRGEWLVMDRYTEQIKTNLLPENDWEWIFSD